MAMGGPSGGAQEGEGDSDGAIFADINITPLTDIFLVLLIIFMVTTSVISSQGKEVDLPSSAIASETPAGVTVTSRACRLRPSMPLTATR